MALILDTSALVVLERALETSSELRLPDEDIGLPAIMWTEALIGVRLRRQRQAGGKAAGTFGGFAKAA